MASEQRLSEQAFRRLVRVLSASQLREFPVERLPQPVPLDAVDEQDDPRKQIVLEDLAWQVSASDLSAGIAATERLPPAIREALEVAESGNDRGVDRLTRLIGEGRQRADAEAAAAGVAAETEADALARDLAEHAMALRRCVAALVDADVGDADLAARIDRAVSHANDMIGRIDPALARYHTVAIEIAQDEMQSKDRQCQKEAKRIRELDDRIQDVREQLNRLQGGMSRFFGRSKRSGAHDELLEQLQDLTREREASETFISEKDLVRWLDLLADASLHVPPQKWHAKAQRARLVLYRLLNTYCLQQESAAEDVAATFVKRENKQAAVDYYLASERFVLEYFSRKRQEVTLWLAGAASEKLEQFDAVRDSIITGYRKREASAL